jgi:hypothetical protein
MPMVQKNISELIEKIKSGYKLCADKRRNSYAVFMFPGQGSQYVNIWQSFYETNLFSKHNWSVRLTYESTQQRFVWSNVSDK